MEEKLSDTKLVSHNAIGDLIGSQDEVQQDQERLRPKMEQCLKQSEDLVKNQNCPAFLKERKTFMEEKWSDYCLSSDSKINKFGELSRIWTEFMQQQEQLVKLLEDAESIEEQNDNLLEIRELKERMDKESKIILLRIRELSKSLTFEASPENKDFFDNQVRFFSTTIMFT